MDVPGVRLHWLSGIRPISLTRVRADALAGLTLAALAIPQVMGYTIISKTPVVTGLYTLLLPLIAFALLGASRHLVVAADSATAAILAANLTIEAPPGSADYLSLTMVVALLVGGLLSVAAMARLGFLADFLSRSALIGLLSGIGIQVAAGELSGLLGLERQGTGALQQIVSVLARLEQAHGLHLLAALVVLGLILGLPRWNPRIPAALIAVVSAILASWLFNLQAHGVPVLGTVPGGLPPLALPAPETLPWNRLLLTAASCFVVILAQSAPTSRAYAQRYEERCEENVDLVGLAAANLAAGLSGTFVVNGSPTKTEMVDAAGGRSQIAQLSAAAVVLLVLLFLTEPLALMPVVVLSTIVFVIGIRLIDLAGLRELWHLQRNEFLIAMATLVTVAQIGVMPGTMLAVVLSLIEQVRHTYQPHTRLWCPDESGHGWQTVAVAPGIFAAPGIVAYRFEANLFYANAHRFTAEVLRLVSDQPSPVEGLVIDASGIDDIDYSAAKALLQLRRQLHARGIRTALVSTSTALVQELQRFGLETVCSDDTLVIATSVKKAIHALSDQSHWPAPRSGSGTTGRWASPPARS